MKMKLHVFLFLPTLYYIYIYGLHPLTCHFLGKRSLSTWCPASERTGIDFFCPCLAELMYSKHLSAQQAPENIEEVGNDTSLHKRESSGSNAEKAISAHRWALTRFGATSDMFAINFCEFELGRSEHKHFRTTEL